MQKGKKKTNANISLQNAPRAFYTLEEHLPIYYKFCGKFL